MVRYTDRTATFEEQVRAFAKGLPEDAPELKPAAYPEKPSSTDPGGTGYFGESWWAFLLANVIGGLLLLALGVAESLTPDAGLLGFIPGLFFNVLGVVLLIQYVVASRSLRERDWVGAMFLLGLSFAGLPVLLDLVAPIEGPRLAPARSRSGSSMEQIGLAMIYNEAYGHPPPLAVCRPDGTPLLSW